MATDTPAVGFAVLPNFIARDGTIEPTLKTLLLALSSYAGADQTCFPSNGTLQTCTGMSERTVRDWLREGERRGYVVTHRRVDPATGAPTSNLYELNFAKWSNPLTRQNLHGVSAESAGGWGGVSPQVGQPVAPGWGGASPPNNTSEQDQGTKPIHFAPTAQPEPAAQPLALVSVKVKEPKAKSAGAIRWEKAEQVRKWWNETLVAKCDHAFTPKVLDSQIAVFANAYDNVLRTDGDANPMHPLQGLMMWAVDVSPLWGRGEKMARHSDDKPDRIQWHPAVWLKADNLAKVVAAYQQYALEDGSQPNIYLKGDPRYA